MACASMVYIVMACVSMVYIVMACGRRAGAAGRSITAAAGSYGLKPGTEIFMGRSQCGACGHAGLACCHMP